MQHPTHGLARAPTTDGSVTKECRREEGQGTLLVCAYPNPPAAVACSVSQTRQAHSHCCTRMKRASLCGQECSTQKCTCRHKRRMHGRGLQNATTARLAHRFMLRPPRAVRCCPLASAVAHRHCRSCGCWRVPWRVSACGGLLQSQVAQSHQTPHH